MDGGKSHHYCPDDDDDGWCEVDPENEVCPLDCSGCVASSSSAAPTTTTIVDQLMTIACPS